MEIFRKCVEIRSSFSQIANTYGINCIDANDLTTGRDFHTKIWKMILSVPIGIAIVSEYMASTTIANIYYEMGLMNALGKETLIIKTSAFKVPSDFVRTEYVEYGNGFERRIQNFFQHINNVVDYYTILADNLVNNPLLAIDYLRRAYLISADETLRNKAIEIINQNMFDDHILLMIKCYFNLQ